MRDIQSQILAKFCRQLDNEELLFRKMQSVSKSEMSLIWFIKISIEHNVMSRLEQQLLNEKFFCDVGIISLQNRKTFL